MLKLKKIKPMFDQLLVTGNLYGWDDKDHSDLITHMKGDMKEYQTVLAVGDGVRGINPGDVVKIDFIRYAIKKHQEGSLKDGVISDNPVVRLHLNEVEMWDENDEMQNCLLIYSNDVKYIMEDFEEVVYNDKDELVPVKQKIIMPTPPKIIL